MTINGMITQVKGRKSINQRGQEVTYYDAFFMDTSGDALTRYPGEIAIKPTEEEIKEQGIVEGAKFTFHVRQVLEVRNGIPVVRAIMRPLTDKKAA